MEKEKNILEMVNYNLKENILKESDGMERDIIKMEMLNILLKMGKGL